jgi:hypothetical protein
MTTLLVDADEGLGGVNVLPAYGFTVSIIVVSFNTRDLLRQCLNSILEECRRLG